MSFHRENIVWQSADGTWSRGFYECHESGGYEDDDFDPEWDVEYDYDALEQVSCGHPSEDAALQSWRGANPGGATVLPYGSGSAAEVAQLDDLAARLEDAQREREASGQRSIFLYSQDRPFHDVRGASKSDDPASLRRRLAAADTQYADAVAEQHSLRMQGYGNDMTREITGLDVKRAGLLNRLVDGGHLDAAAQREHRITDLSNQVAALNRGLDSHGSANRPRLSGFALGPESRETRVNRAACVAARDATAAELEQLRHPPTRTRSQKKAPTAAPSSAPGRVAGGVPSGGQFAAKRHGEPAINLPRS